MLFVLVPVAVTFNEGGGKCGEDQLEQGHFHIGQQRAADG